MKLTGLERPDPNAAPMPASMTSQEEATLFVNVLRAARRSRSTT